MKIGLVCPYDLDMPGGVQHIVLALAGHLRDGGDDVLVLGPGEGGDEYHSIGRSVALRGNRSTVPVTLDPRALRRLRGHLAGVDVVHVHEPLMPFGGWGALWARRPTVATFHADPARWTRLVYRAGSGLARRGLGGATVTAVSSVAAGALPRSWHPVEIVPNAIDTSAYGSAGGRRPDQVAFLGRDEPRKGLDVLLRAWPDVRRQHARATLVVLGADRGTEIDGVEFRGRVSEEEKRRYLTSSAVFVAPNLGGESFGIVLAEAMAAGCAVVASDIGAFRPVVGASGRLVPAGDAAALGAEVASLLEDSTAVQRLGDSAREWARRFDWAVVGGSYRRLYESAVAGGGSTMGSQKE